MIVHLEIYTIFLLSTLFDYSIFGLKFLHLLVGFFLLSNIHKIRLNTSFVLLISVIIIYAYVGYYKNTLSYVEYDSFEESEIRPILSGAQLIVELIFIKNLFERIKQDPEKKIIFLTFFIVLLSFLIWPDDRSFSKNESGLLAQQILIIGYLCYRSNKKLIGKITTLSLVIITKSSTVLATPLLFARNRLFFLILPTILIPLLIFTNPSDYVSQIVTSKFELFFNPPLSDQYGGRYWANLTYLAMFIEAPLLGHGFESFNHYRSNIYSGIVFDHGGMDFLNFLASFGIVGSSFIYITIYYYLKNTIRFKFSIDIIGMLIACLLMVKGIGVLTSMGSLTLILLLLFKLR